MPDSNPGLSPSRTAELVEALREMDRIQQDTDEYGGREIAWYYTRERVEKILGLAPGALDNPPTADDGAGKTEATPSGPWRPTWATHPGETLREWMDEAGMGEVELAELTGIHDDDLSHLLRGTASVTEDMAGRLQRRTGVSAAFWLNMQALYDERTTTVPLDALRNLLDAIPLRNQGPDAGGMLDAAAAMLDAVADDVEAARRHEPDLDCDRIIRALRTRSAAARRRALRAAAEHAADYAQLVVPGQARLLSGRRWPGTDAHGVLAEVAAADLDAVLAQSGFAGTLEPGRETAMPPVVSGGTVPSGEAVSSGLDHPRAGMTREILVDRGHGEHVHLHVWAYPTPDSPDPR